MGHTASGPTSWSLPAEKIITEHELGLILQAARKKSERDYVFFAIAANTGLRLCEVGHLMVDDLRADGRLCVTRRKKKILRPELIETRADVVTLMRNWIGSRDMGYMFPGRAKECFIERSNGVREQVCIGGHASLRDVQRKFKEALMRCGLEAYGRGVHATRHYAITRMYAKTRDLRACQLFAGHSSSTITERYASVLDLREKIESVGSTL